MTYHFCTIATYNYLPFVQTLLHSLKRNGESCQLHVLITTNESLPPIEGIQWYLPDELMKDDQVMQIFTKYNHQPNELRWALKPFFLTYLLQKTGKIIYLDNDVYFFRGYEFLFELLEQFSILLTPHWTCFEPIPFSENFETSFQIGLFNAGFIGATQRGISTLNWWGRLCLYKTIDDTKNGFFVDQKYLDMSLILDEKVGILRHLGCNLSSVNMHQNRRVKVEKEVLINEKYPVVFIHFNAETVKHILNQNDFLLKPHYDEYEKAFALTGHKLSSFKHQLEPAPTVIDFKRKLKLRTRLKQLVLKIYQRL